MSLGIIQRIVLSFVISLLCLYGIESFAADERPSTIGQSSDAVDTGNATVDAEADLAPTSNEPACDAEKCKKLKK